MTEIIKKYRSRLIVHGWLKSLMLGAFIGFSALLITTFVFWFVGFDKLWVAIPIFVAVTAAFAVIFYFAKYRPDEKQIAMKIDALGLEERMITMAQFKYADNYLAKMQREDAEKALAQVNPKSIKFAASTLVIVALAVSFVFAGGMTTTSALANAGYIKYGKDYYAEATAEPPVTYEITYKVEGNGKIEGMLDKTSEIVNEGESSTVVTAAPDEGSVFSGWQVNDGESIKVVDDIVTFIKEVTKDVTVTAQFEQIEEEFFEDEQDALSNISGGDGQPGGPADPNAPPQQSDQSGDGQGPGAGGGLDSNRDQVYDGDTNYKDVIGESSNDANDSVNGNNNIDDGDKDGVGGYYGSL